MRSVIHKKFILTLTILGLLSPAALSLSAHADDSADTSVTYSTPYIGEHDYSLGADVTLDVNVAAVNALEITLSKTLVSLDLTPGMVESGYDSKDLVVTVGTTGSAGYTLTMDPTYNDASTTSLTRTESLDDTTPVIETIDYTVSPATFASTADTATVNKWGFMLSATNLDVDKTVYNPVLASNTLNSNTTPVSNDPTTISFAAKADHTLPAGNYRATLKFMAVANPTSMSIAHLKYMQDFTTLSKTDRADVLDSMDLNAQYQLTDNRDYKKYWVSKLETACANPRASKITTGSDAGKCYQVWMTQNLDLDLGGTINGNIIVLNSDNTDLNAYGTGTMAGTGIYADGYTVDNTGRITWTPSYNTVTDVADTFNTQTLPQSLDVGDNAYYYPGTTAGENGDTPAGCPSNQICKHYSAGNYYNWTAAVASNNSAAQTTNYTQADNSICPAGWTLPTGLTSENGYSDFNYLLVKQGIIGNFVVANQSTSWSENGYFNVQSSPLYIIKSGRFGSGAFYDQMSHSYLWFGATRTSTHGHNLYYNSDVIYPAYHSNRQAGSPVRCLLREYNDIGSIKYMQDFAKTSAHTERIMESMPANTSYQLTDNRDGKDYWVTKLQTACANPRVTASSDGNCYQIWMTQNLDLDLETTPNKVAALTSKNTDLNTAATGIYSAGYTVKNGLITYTPSATTATDVASTSNQNYAPVSLDTGEQYYYQNSAVSTTCTGTGDECKHWHVGNYYNWSAAVASDNSENQTENYAQAANSICPAGWRMPTGLTSATCSDSDNSGCSDFNFLLVQQGITTNYVGANMQEDWASDKYAAIQLSPLYLIRNGWVNFEVELGGQAAGGFSWNSSVFSEVHSYGLRYVAGYINAAFYDARYYGFSVRCLAR